jgi:type IV secretion system protein VirD4
MEAEHAKRPVGFTFGDADRTPERGFVDPILMESEGHLITIAPTGAGKGIGCVIPALLRHNGPAIVIDPKGENAVVTARRRREMGQEVIILDPTGITGLPQGTLNPLDFIDPEDASGVVNAAAIASAMLPMDIDSERNRFWVNRGRQLLIAVILHVVTDLPAGERNLTKVREIINQVSSNPHEFAERLSNSRHPEVRLIEGNLKISAQETLGGILSFAQEGVDFLRGPQISAAIASTSFDLKKVVRGHPMTIYIVIPPHLLESLSRVLRLWVSMLLGLIMTRRSRPSEPTLFLLDEAAQLGELSELRTAITLLRGYGLQTWSFWQDVSQLKLLYPRDWQTMINNCRVVQSFGPNNRNAAADMTDLVGFLSAEKFLALDQDEMLLQVAGDEAIIAQRPNYLTDPIFKGHFDPNSLFDADRDPLPERRPMREYIRPERAVIKQLIRGRPLLVPGIINPVDELLAALILQSVPETPPRKRRRTPDA